MDEVCNIEKATGVPVTSSNHAMAWHAMRLAGNDEILPQWGRLWENGGK
jgi:maleate isomerase